MSDRSKQRMFYPHLPQRSRLNVALFEAEMCEKNRAPRITQVSALVCYDTQEAGQLEGGSDSTGASLVDHHRPL